MCPKCDLVLEAGYLLSHLPVSVWNISYEWLRCRCRFMRAVQELSACVLSVTSKGDICCHICLSHRRPNTSYQQKAALKQRHQALIQFLVCHCCVLNTFIFQLKHKCWDTVCYWSQHTLAIMINFRYFPPLLYVLGLAMRRFLLMRIDAHQMH